MSLLWQVFFSLKVFLALNSSKEKQVTYSRSPYILGSFYYEREQAMYREHLEGCKMFLLDSGAFTFLNSAKGKPVDWERYVSNYADFIVANNIKYYFELDVDAIVGYERVKKFRRYLESKTRRPSIPVWHKTRGLDEYKKLTEEYSYIAIGGIAIKTITQKQHKFFTPLLTIAAKNGCKVHGLGFTCINELPKYPFYSVDSSSYLGCVRYGSTYKYQFGKLKTIPRDPEKRVKDRHSLLQHNIDEWTKYQNYADKYV